MTRNEPAQTTSTSQYICSAVNTAPNTEGGLMPTMPAKPCVRLRHSVSTLPSMLAKASDTSAKYQVERRKAGNAIRAPAPAVSSRVQGSASQNDQW